MTRRNPILSAALLCATALLTMGNDGGCGGGSAPYCADGICDVDEGDFDCGAECEGAPVCGDGSCDSDEDAFNCATDCAVVVCGDDICGFDEECPEDCSNDATCADGDCDPNETCGDGNCDPNETCASCAADCGDCCIPESDARFCERLGKDCGSVRAADNCGHQRAEVICGTCEEPQTCGANEVCSSPGTSHCGDGVCDVAEDEVSCSSDCGVAPFCGDGNCDPNETCASCAADCGDCCNPESDARFCERLGKDCGSVRAADNCGHQRAEVICGTCEEPQTCGADNLCGSPSEVRPSAGCGLAGDSGRQDLRVTIRGVQRTYRVQFPAKYDPNEPLPLIFYFHWLGGTIDEALSTYGQAIWEVGNASNEAAFVWPQGLPVYGGGETGWDLACDGEDMEFFDAMLSDLADSRCIDLNRVFSTGFSFGADMSVSLACCRDASVVRAVAPASGAFDQYNADFVCPGLSPPSMRYSYGAVDPIYTPSEFNDVITFFHSQLGCSTDYDLVSVSPCGETWTEDGSTVSCTCKSYRDCSQPFIDCEFANMGHTTAAGWPEDTWDYFMSF